MPLRSREPIPFQRLDIVKIDAPAIGIKQSKPKLPAAIALLGERLPLCQSGCVVALAIGTEPFGIVRGVSAVCN